MTTSAELAADTRARLETATRVVAGALFGEPLTTDDLESLAVLLDRCTDDVGRVVA